MFNNRFELIRDKLLNIIDKIFEGILHIINHSEDKQQMIDSIENYRIELKKSLIFKL